MSPRPIRLGMLLAQHRQLRAIQKGKLAEAEAWAAIAALAGQRLHDIAEAERMVERERRAYAETRWADTRVADTVPALLPERAHGIGAEHG